MRRAKFSCREAIQHHVWHRAAWQGHISAAAQIKNRVCRHRQQCVCPARVVWSLAIGRSLGRARSCRADGRGQRMKEETRHVRYYLRSGKQVPPRRVYCYAIETASRYEPQNSGDVLRKKTTRTVWRAANPNEKAFFNSAKECRAWVATIRQGPCSAGQQPELVAAGSKRWSRHRAGGCAP